MRSPATSPRLGHKQTADGYLLAQAMTKLPTARVLSLLTSNWDTWISPHATNTELAAALGITMPAVRLVGPRGQRHHAPGAARLTTRLRDVNPVERPTRFWIRSVPGSARHTLATMPWATLVAGCASGTVVLALMAHFAGHSPLNQDNVRLTFLPAVGALAFVPHVQFRPVTQTTPVPTWMAPAGQVLLAIPVLAVTCWVQLELMTSTYPARDANHLPAAYPLIAQLIGWSLLALSIAACCERTRYAALSGATAAPVTFVAIAAASCIPPLSGHLLSPPNTAHAVTITWYTISAAALALAIVAIRDQWHRYARRLHV